MGSKKLKQFREKLQENKGKSMDGAKLYGRTDKIEAKSIEVWDEDKVIHVDINSHDVSEYDKVDLQYQCKSLLPFVSDYKEGEKIYLSQVCNSVFDIQLKIKQLASGKQLYKFVTL